MTASNFCDIVLVDMGSAPLPRGSEAGQGRRAWEARSPPQQDGHGAIVVDLDQHMRAKDTGGYGHTLSA